MFSDNNNGQTQLSNEFKAVGVDKFMEIIDNMEKSTIPEAEESLDYIGFNEFTIYLDSTDE